MHPTEAVLAEPASLHTQAAEWLSQYPTIRHWMIDGDLGAGKTTLVQAFSQALGVEEAVASPTFALAHTYRSPGGPVHHLDLYRLSSLDEALDAGLLDTIDGTDYAFVEWAERLPEFRPAAEYIHIYLSVEADGTRRARLQPRYEHA